MMPSVISGDANVSATEFGFLDGVTSGLQSQIDSKLNLAGGKILQIVRATDTTARTTTSTSSTDTNLNVTITPQRSNSAILLIATFRAQATSGVTQELRAFVRITDNSNNVLSGNNDALFGTTNSGTGTVDTQVVLVAYSTPATTSATTYKTRFGVVNSNCTLSLPNDFNTAQFFAIEVSA